MLDVDMDIFTYVPVQNMSQKQKVSDCNYCIVAYVSCLTKPIETSSHIA